MLCTATPSYLGVETIDCAACSDPYDYSANTDTFTDTEIFFWDWQNTDYTTIAQDWICPMNDEDTCVTDFMWLNMRTDNSDMNGYLGLNLDNSIIEYYYPDDPIYPSLPQAMYDANIIAEPIFSLAMTSDARSSNWIDYGFINTAQITSLADLVTIYTAYNNSYGYFYWAFDVLGIRFRQKVSPTNTYEDSVTAADEYHTFGYYGVVAAEYSSIDLPEQMYFGVMEIISASFENGYQV